MNRFLISFILLLICVTTVFAAKVSTTVRVVPAPPNLTATVQFSEPSGNNRLDAEETGKLIIKVVNSGKGDAFDVVAEVGIDKALNDLSFDRKVSVGTIAAGSSASAEVVLRAGENMPTGDPRFTIEVKEANGFNADPISIAFSVKAFEPPKLVVADIGIDDQNGNGRVEPLENVEVTARIQNMGRGDARNVVVDIEYGKNVFIGGDGITHFELGNLNAGKFKDVKFIFYTNKQIHNGERIPISVKISEARPQFAAASALNLTMNAAQKKTQEFVVKGLEEPAAEITLATGLSVDVDMNIPEGKSAGKDDVAVVIGNKNYSQSGIPNVEFADRDARIMKEYLIKTFGFNPINIIYAEDATVGKFNEIFGTETNHQGKLFKYVKKGISSVFVYYVGHGAPDLESQEAYFVPVDANPQYISTNGYKLQTLYGNLSKLPVKNVTVVIDACFSGNSEKGFLLKNISPAMVKVKKEYAAKGTVITSAGTDQVSSWYAEKKHSLFTYYFLKGVQGEADANHDGVITLKELSAYVREHVPYMAQRLNNVEQQPVLSGNENEILVTLKTGKK